MAGKKRSSDGNAQETRATKAKKTGTDADSSKAGKKNGSKPALSSDQFLALALPLHLNLTHTPPILPSSGEDDTTSVHATDPGWIGTSTLVPTKFSTGSYGWKGNKKVTIELADPDDPEAEKIKVQLNISINGTVLGSKPAKGGKEKGNKDDAPEEDEGNEADE